MTISAQLRSANHSIPKIDCSRETRLAMAQRHVAEGRKIVGHQKRLMERQKQAGFDTIIAEDLLRVFELSLAVIEDDLASLNSER